MRKQSVLRWGLPVLLLAVMTGCPTGGGPAVITLSPSTANLLVGDALDLTAASSSVLDTSFNWSVNNTGVVELSATTGKTVTVTALAEGTAILTATGNNSGRTHSVQVKVSKAVTEEVFIPSGKLATGLKIEVQSVSIPADRRPVVTFLAKDSKGNLLAKSELTDARFILAYLEPGVKGETGRYVSYTTRIDNGDGITGNADDQIQATTDSAALNGVTQAANGVMTYRFAKVLPADYPQNLTHQVSGQFRRLYAVDGLSYLDNPSFLFRPDGQAVTAKREISDTATCNECHSRLAIHGGSRREYQYCITCHTTQSTDAGSGNTVDMAPMIHKIHMGEELPSVQAGQPYFIVGFNNSMHDYSTVVFPQDVRNCEVCHNTAAKSDADYYLTKPTLAGCASCHDRTWFGPSNQTPPGFTDHKVGPQADSSACALCHTPAAIAAHHEIPQQSDEAPGLKLDITQVFTNPQDGTLRILFTAKNGDGSPVTDLAALSSVSSNFAWPVPDYEKYTREAIAPTPTGTLVSKTSPTGEYDYTFKGKMPLDTDGTFAVAMEGRRNFTWRGATFVQGLESPSIHYFTIDGSTPVERRMVTDEAACLKCHSEIRAHGEQRVGLEYCLFCHNPKTTDVSRRPAPALPPETVNMKDMLHKIHSGENLTQPYTVYGFGGTAYDFTHVRYPGDRRNCGQCHVSGGERLPVAPEAIPTVVMQGETLISEKGPERAACTSCHDSPTVDMHALLNTSVGGVETCSICHGEGSIAAVSLMHKIEP